MAGRPKPMGTDWKDGMASAQGPSYSTPNTAGQAAALFRSSRIEQFGAAIQAPRDISKYNRHVPSPMGPATQASIKMSNHLSGTGQGSDPMASIMDDQVKLDGKKNESKAPRKGDPNQYRKKGVTVGKKARKGK